MANWSAKALLVAEKVRSKMELMGTVKTRNVFIAGVKIPVKATARFRGNTPEEFVRWLSSSVESGRLKDEGKSMLDGLLGESGNRTVSNKELAKLAQFTADFYREMEKDNTEADAGAVLAAQ